MALMSGLGFRLICVIRAPRQER